VESLVGDRPLTLEPSLTTWGGVVVRTGDGAHRIDNTLEARLRAGREDLLLLAAEALGAEAIGRTT
jgi:vacuolar-type H+-ATPase subunit E/Vma4